jgi:hypothetical protein
MSYTPLAQLIALLAGSGNESGTGGIPMDMKGAPDGVAELDGGAKIRIEQLQMAQETIDALDTVDAAITNHGNQIQALSDDLDGKQPAGNYLTSITGSMVNDALGFVPQPAGSYATGNGTATGTNTGDQFTAMTASRILGRATAGFGPAEQLTGAQVALMLAPFDQTTKGLVPAPTSISGRFLKDDGTWAAPPAAGASPTIYALANPHANSTLTPTTIGSTGADPDWVHTLVAGKVYRFTIFATYQAAALTTGGRMNLLGAGGLAGTVAGMMWGGIQQAAAATTLEVPIYSFANGAGSFLLTTAVAPINSPHVWGADFVVVCSTGGTLALQWASEVASSAAQLNAGAVMMVEVLN